MPRRTRRSPRRSRLLRLAPGQCGCRAPDPGPAVPASAPAAEPQAEDERKTPRTLGDAAAKVTVMEFFSLTCTHCAAFARETMPQIEKELIAPGKVRFVYRDFPLDQVALTAAMVARYLPPDRY